MAKVFFLFFVFFTCCCSWVWHAPRAPESVRSSARWGGAQARPVLGRWRWLWCQQDERWTAEVEQTLLELKEMGNKESYKLALFPLLKRQCQRNKDPEVQTGANKCQKAREEEGNRGWIKGHIDVDKKTERKVKGEGEWERKYIWAHRVYPGHFVIYYTETGYSIRGEWYKYIPSL